MANQPKYWFVPKAQSKTNKIASQKQRNYKELYDFSTGNLKRQQRDQEQRMKLL